MLLFGEAPIGAMEGIKSDSKYPLQVSASKWSFYLCTTGLANYQGTKLLDRAGEPIIVFLFFLSHRERGKKYQKYSL